jgi:hypothetical protein
MRSLEHLAGAGRSGARSASSRCWASKLNELISSTADADPPVGATKFIHPAIHPRVCWIFPCSRGRLLRTFLSPKMVDVGSYRRRDQCRLEYSRLSRQGFDFRPKLMIRPFRYIHSQCRISADILSRVRYSGLCAKKILVNPELRDLT